MQLRPHVHVDKRERDEHGQAEAERDHDARRHGARPMQIGDRHAQLDVAEARRATGDRHGRPGHGAQGGKSEHGGDDDDDGDAALRARQDRQPGQHAAARQRKQGIPQTWPPAPFRNQVAKQSRNRQVVRTPERRNRECERGEKSVCCPQPKLARID